jgi:hypothetical protein
MDSEAWHEKECYWEQPRCFYRISTRMALHSPLTYNEDVSRAIMEAKTLGFIIKASPLILLKSGLFRGDLLVEVNPPHDPAKCRDEGESSPCLKLQGAFYTVVTKAPLFKMGTVIEKLMRDLKKKGWKAKDFYLCLANCPSCAKEKGNQTVIFAHLKPQDRET